MGVVMKAASPPAPAPAMKSLVSLDVDETRVDNNNLKFSYSVQYIIEKGASLKRVGTKPSNKDVRFESSISEFHLFKING